MLRKAIVFFTMMSCQPLAATFINQQLIAETHLKDLSAEELDANWHLNEFFGSVFVINLPQSQDRLARIRGALSQVGVEDFEVFPAIDGRKDVEEKLWKKMDRNWAKIDLSTLEGQRAFDSQRQAEVGCYLSHLHLIQAVKERFDYAIKDLREAEEKM